MSDYLQAIEHQFSRIRGKPILLSPLDFHIALEWEKREIPLFIVLRAMETVGEKYKQKGLINSIRYFEQAVDIEYAEWQQSQVGKNKGEEMKETEETTVLPEITVVMLLRNYDEKLFDLIKKQENPPLQKAIFTVIEHLWQVEEHIQSGDNAEAVNRTLDVVQTAFEQELQRIGISFDELQLLKLEV